MKILKRNSVTKARRTSGEEFIRALVSYWQVERDLKMMRENKPHFSKRQFTVLIAVVLTGLAFAGYYLLSNRTEHKPAGPPEKITLAYSATTDSVFAEVAQQLGYFEEEGLEVTPHLHPYGKLALQEVLDGTADFATAAETPVMLAVMKGAKISVIATIQTSNRNTAIVARKDKGILTPADLKGRTIGTTLGTSGDFFMDAFLAVHGIARKDMKVLDVKAEKLQNTLMRGDVDAVSAFNPYVVRLQKKLGNRGITFYDENIYTQTFNIVAGREFINRNPGTVRKMLLALIKAEEFVMQNPEEAQKLVADISRLDIGMVREVWSGINFGVTLDQSLVLALEEESRWAMNSGVIVREKIPNYLDFIYFDGLESIRPKSVRILR